MSDEIIKSTNQDESAVNEEHSDIREKRRHARKKRRAKKNRTLLIIILLLVVSIGCTMYINMDNPLLSGMFLGFGISNKGVNIEFEKTEDYAITEFNGDVVVARNTIVSCIDDKMNSLWTVEQNNAMPVIKTSGKYVLTYSFDVAGAVLTKGGKSQTIATENPIIGGSVNKNGYCAIVTREKGYKAQVLVFSPDGEVVYKWHSADNYILDVDVSYDNKCLAVATADFSTDMVSGGLMFFNFSQAKPYAGQILENNMIMEIKFVGKDSLLVVGDIGSAVFGGNGEKKKEYLYDGKKLNNYDIGTENNLVLALTQGDSVSKDTEIKILNDNLKEKGNYVAKGAVSTINAVGDRVLLSTDRDIILLSKGGKELNLMNMNKDIKEAVLFGKGKSALIASGGIAEIIDVD